MSARFTALILLSGAVICGVLYLGYREIKREQREEALSRLLRGHNTNPRELSRCFNEMQRNKGLVSKGEWDNLMGIVGIEDPKLLRQMWRHRGGTDEPNSRIAIGTNGSHSRIAFQNNGSASGRMELLFDEHDELKVGKIGFERFTKVLQARAEILENKQITLEAAETIARDALASLGKDKTCEIRKSEFCTFFLGDFKQTPGLVVNGHVEDELKIDISMADAKRCEPEAKHRAQ